ncbi:MAG TPA: hypothetical protein VLT84_00695 [Acidobacteriota bacterium]|nr:hypothetical protein [Acidobacteriota bacterium]
MRSTLTASIGLRSAARAVLAPSLVLALLAPISSPSAQSLAQTEGDLKRAEARLQDAFEGTHVVVKLDMPATASGVDITPDAQKPLNLPDYQSRLKKHGTSLRRGESVMVTKVKVKAKLIEFQLGGGGYGTFFDEKASSVGGGAGGKSTREKNLERDLKKERDPAKRRAMDEELDALRRGRRSEERENEAESRQAEELAKDRIRGKALEGGSRFNIRYPDGVPSDALSPESVRDVLDAYLTFEDPQGARAGGSGGGSRGGYRDGDDAAGPGRGGEPTAVRKGSRLDEVEDDWGRPSSTKSTVESGWNVTRNRYARDRWILDATFIEGVLVRYTLSEE